MTGIEPKRNGHDPCAVQTRPLARLITEYEHRWRRQRPNVTRRFAAPGDRPVPYLDPLEALAISARLPLDRLVAVRSRYDPHSKKSVAQILRLAGVLGGRTTELKVADTLVAALGRPEAFHDGTLHVLPNPEAPPAVRRGCCSGSG